jgi:uncharacterized protein YjiS (DUF1127 family)
MRDFEINEANSRAAFGRLTWIVRVVTNWRMRKDLKRLQKLSDYQLRDIGLSRTELHRLVCIPLHADRVWETERRELLESRYHDVDMPYLAPLTARGVALPVSAMPAWMNMVQKPRSAISAPRQCY